MGPVAVHIAQGAGLFARRLAGRLQREPEMLDATGITVRGERGACATAVRESGGIVVRDGDDDRFDTISAADLPPISVSWQVLATDFWEATSGRKGTPGGLRLVATDTDEDLALGSGAGYEIHGEAEALAEYVTGQSLLIDLIYEGRVRVAGTLSQLSVMVGNGMVMVPRG